VTPAQPLVFESVDVLEERGVLESVDAGALRRSPSWDRAYAAFKRGEQLALPHFDERPTDANKQAKLSSAYARYRAGELGADELPDLSDIFPDDPHVRAELGLQAEPDATPSEALLQACGGCHNDRLDQSISRARFNIDIARMSRAELDLAIARIELPPTTEGAMPPPGFRQLGAQVRERLLAYLRDDARSSEDDALLGRAARLGMVGDLPY
jgi:mono/diheme cytochrome c family protein